MCCVGWSWSYVGSGSLQASEGFSMCIRFGRAEWACGGLWHGSWVDKWKNINDIINYQHRLILKSSTKSIHNGVNNVFSNKMTDQKYTLTNQIGYLPCVGRWMCLASHLSHCNVQLQSPTRYFKNLSKRELPATSTYKHTHPPHPQDAPHLASTFIILASSKLVLYCCLSKTCFYFLQW